MRKGKLFHSVLAAGMAAVLAAVPMSAFAGATDETEFMAGLEDAVEELSASAYESRFKIDFGDGLYDLSGEDGADVSWMKGFSADAKLVPGQDALDAELQVAMNDTTLGHALVSYEPASGMLYLSIPEYFDQAIAVNPQEFARNLTSGSAGGDDSGYGQIMQLFSGMAMEIVGQIQELAASLPAEVWQQELTNYLTPVMSNLQQDSVEEKLTVGDLSADVQTMILTLPSEKMEEVIKGTLDAMADDQVVAAVLQSDAVSSISSFVSMVSGGSVQISGQDLLDQYRSIIDGIAAGDFTGFPGAVVKISTSPEGNAAGLSVAMEAGGETYDLYSFKGILDGEKNAFEFKPEAMLLSMTGTQINGDIDIVGQGSTEGGKLNEEVDILLNGETIGKMTITDYDLEAIQLGFMIGTFRFEVEGMSLELTYDVEEDGTRTVKYLVNDKVFYDAAAYVGPTADDKIEQIDKAGAVVITTMDELVNWIGTFKADEAQKLLEEAGVPMNTETLAA